MSWLEQASCRGKPVSWWFPQPYDRFAADVAIAVCRGCEVRAQCLAAALAEEAHVDVSPSGIRGGYTAEQRRRLARRTG